MLALQQAGLLQVTQEQQRAGRPMRFYRASAQAYFVPHAMTPDADSGERFERQFLPVDRLLAHALGREFERAMAQQSGGREWGMRLYWDGQQVQIDQGYADAELREVLTGWQGPEMEAFTGLAAGWLTVEEVRQVREEFLGLMHLIAERTRANQASRRGQPFAVRTVVAPISAEELSALRP